MRIKICVCMLVSKVCSVVVCVIYSGLIYQGRRQEVFQGRALERSRGGLPSHFSISRGWVLNNDFWLLQWSNWRISRLREGMPLLPMPAYAYAIYSLCRTQSFLHRIHKNICLLYSNDNANFDIATLSTIYLATCTLSRWYCVEHHGAYQRRVLGDYRSAAPSDNWLASISVLLKKVL